MTPSPPVTTLTVGQELPSLELPAISRTTLALFAGASGDHNPIHIDLDNARSAGLDDVFAHGMLSMGHLGRYLTETFGQDRLRRWSVRFTSITPVLAQPTCTGAVSAIDEAAGTADIDLAVSLADGTVTVTGRATIALDESTRVGEATTADDTETAPAQTPQEVR